MSGGPPSSRSVAATISRCLVGGRAALICYWPAGYPDLTMSHAVVASMARGGADVIEVGLPYSDPLMDGPVIADAVDASLKGGTDPTDALRLLEAAASGGTQALLMSYWNPVLSLGPDRLAEALEDAGGSGLILPDVGPDASAAWAEIAIKRGLDSVYLVAPNTTADRMEFVATRCRGMVYAASRLGTTGVRVDLPAETRQLVARVREVTDTPVTVGLGVSTPEQAQKVGSFADGVILGSALLSAFNDAASPSAAVGAVEALVAAMRAGLEDRVGTTNR